jgi:hypothetical protein
MKKKAFLSIALFTIFVIVETPCYGISFNIIWPSIDSGSKSIVRAATNFLGVNPKYIASFGEFKGKKNGSLPLLVLISDELLKDSKSIDNQKLIEPILQGNVNPLVLLNGLQGEESNSILLSGIKKFKGSRREGKLVFSGDHKEILRELGGLTIPVSVEKGFLYFEIEPAKNKEIEPLIWLQDEDGFKYNILAIKRLGKGRVFLGNFPNCRISNGNETYRNLPSVLPLLIYLKSIGGEFCWHKKKIQANLTIDDPWFVEPYGNLSYKGLLREMERVNFHTTIAFIPWNYDRNHREVIELVLNNPNRYSMAYHGNNHDRREFGDFKNHTFRTQEKAISQAVLRLDEFTRLTAIPVDKVMIFPHAIAPKQTLETLKQHNFLASINYSILPLGESGPVDYDTMLNTVNTKYYGFPLLQRFNPKVDRTIINFLLFLGKPLLFYTHQDYFYKNIASFNELAEFVNNRTGHKAQWVNLKSICNDLYMERRRTDGGYDIRLMARSVVINNMTINTASYHIKEVWSGMEDIEKILINGIAVDTDFVREMGKPIVLKSGERVTIEIFYRQPPHQQGVTLERQGLRNTLIRGFSDIRDRYLSTNKIGRIFINLTKYILNGAGSNY